MADDGEAEGVGVGDAEADDPSDLMISAEVLATVKPPTGTSVVQSADVVQ